MRPVFHNVLDIDFASYADDNTQYSTGNNIDEKTAALENASRLTI